MKKLDSRLLTAIKEDPIVNYIYSMHMAGEIDYNDMLIKMVCDLSETRLSIGRE